MKLYRFSPISNKSELLNVVDYIAEKTTELCKKITGKELPISSLTIFSHYSEEFDNLQKILFSLGKLDHIHNGPFVRLESPVKLKMCELNLVRIRKPDPYRMQVGCNDFEVEDYLAFKDSLLEAHPNNLREIINPEFTMIEFFDPDFDVLGYVLK